MVVPYQDFQAVAPPSLAGYSQFEGGPLGDVDDPPPLLLLYGGDLVDNDNLEVPIVNQVDDPESGAERIIRLGGHRFLLLIKMKRMNKVPSDN